MHPAPKPRSTDAWLGTAMILAALAGWTSIPLFLRHFAKLELDAWAVNGWRYAFSAVMWLPVLLWHAQRGSTPKGLWRAALVPSLFNAAAQVCFGLAPYYIDPGLMTFALRLHGMDRLRAVRRLHAELSRSARTLSSIFVSDSASVPRNAFNARAISLFASLIISSACCG